AEYENRELRDHNMFLSQNAQSQEGGVSPARPPPLDPCIEGQPSHAAANLLGRLEQAGVTLRYHGDFDRAGLQITAHMITRFAAAPWRMSSADYLEDLDHASLAFDAEVPPTSWDPSLQAAIRTHQKVLLEESCLNRLLADLAG
ncbi:MAG: DUF2399 domain-containing protein, partial [Candidatus Paceibacterota bacterium]